MPNPALGVNSCVTFTDQGPDLVNWLPWLHFTTHAFPGLLSLQRCGQPFSSILFGNISALRPINARGWLQHLYHSEMGLCLPQNPQYFPKGYIKPWNSCLQPLGHIVASVKRTLDLNSEVFILALNLTIPIINDYYNNIYHLLLAWDILISLLSTLHIFLSKILHSSIIFPL